MQSRKPAEGKCGNHKCPARYLSPCISGTKFGEPALRPLAVFIQLSRHSVQGPRRHIESSIRSAERHKYQEAMDKICEVGDAVCLKDQDKCGLAVAGSNSEAP